MTTGIGSRSLTAFLPGLLRGALVPVLLITGLLMAPVTCTCGASVPHGHSLFQLPYHHHSNVDAGQDAVLHADHHRTSLLSTGLSVSEETVKEVACDGDEVGYPGFDPGSYVALSNLSEKQDGAALKAPPSSSIGQPISISQPSVITLPAQKCESITLPPVRDLEGTQTSPETPPPKVPTLV